MTDVNEFATSAISDTDTNSNSVNENAAIGTQVSLTAFASDADATNNIVTYSLQDDDGGNFAIDANNGVVTTAAILDREALGANRSITIRATSSDGSFTDQVFTIAINDLDEFNTGSVSDTDGTSNAVNENASIGTNVGLTAQASDQDATNSTITYSLFNNDGGNFAIDANTGVVSTAALLDREALGATRQITVRATSTDGSYTDQVFSIQINDLDEHNVGAVSDADATANAVDENASIGTIVGLTATASDADATTNTITYSLFDNDSGRFSIDANTGIVTTAAVLDRETLGATRSITVRATSADGSHTDQSFTIAINDLDEFNTGTVSDTNPTINAVNENVSPGTLVGITAFASDVDATNNAITYSLFDDDGGNFAIDANSGVVTTAAALDRETLGAIRSITVRATSADGSFSDQVFSITLNDLDEFDTSAITDTNATTNAVDENASIGTTVGITAFASDADATHHNITYSLFDDDGGNFAIDSNSGIVTVAGLLDREMTGSTRNIIVRATSSDGSFSDQTFSIAINDLDEFNTGTIADLDNNVNQVAENVPIGTVVGITASASDLDATNNVITYTLIDDDGGNFSIDPMTGVVRTSASLDRETLGAARSITVRATSADGSFTDQAYSIALNDIDEFNTGPVIDTNSTPNAVDENASIGTTVGVVASANDADATNNNIIYSLVDSDGGNFAIDANTGVVITLATLDREALGASRNITVRATSTDGSSTDQLFTIAIRDIDEFNTGSITDQNPSANNIDENASIGTQVGITATASDADATNNTITYSLIDSDSGNFAIDANTGTVTTAAILDRELLGATRSITVRATSADGSFSDQAYSIALNDLDEFNTGPQTDADPAANAVDENVAVGTTVGIIASASDADASNNTITYSLLDDDGANFAIDPISGIVTTNASLNREALGPYAPSS